MSLEELAVTPRLLVALDFDGTLSPLVDEPMTARMAPEAAAAVQALVSAPDTTVALVSGRTLDDLRVIAEHDDASTIILAGSHGAQWWHPAGASHGAGSSVDGAGSSVDGAGSSDDDAEASDAEASDDDAGAHAAHRELLAEAEAIAATVGGAWIEPKAFGFAVHTRRSDAREAETVHARIADLMAERAPHWRRRTGHALTEYAFRAEGKDSAVAALREQTRATGVLFAGDDVTDEDALRSLLPGDVGIRVGDGDTAATVRVRDIAELSEVLLALAHRRIAARQ